MIKRISDASGSRSKREGSTVRSGHGLGHTIGF
jgi:hypothetical protein